MAVTTAIEGIWEKVAVLLQPPMFDASRINVIKKEHDGEFIRANSMLQQWSSNYDDKATNQQIILAMCQAGLVDKAGKIFGREFVQAVHPNSPGT